MFDPQHSASRLGHGQSHNLTLAAWSGHSTGEAALKIIYAKPGRSPIANARLGQLRYVDPLHRLLGPSLSRCLSGGVMKGFLKRCFCRLVLAKLVSHGSWLARAQGILPGTSAEEGQ